MSEPVGTWRRTKAGRWVVQIPASAVEGMTDRVQVRVKRRRGGTDLVTVYKHGEPFHDDKSGERMVYAHPSSVQRAA